MTRGLNFRLNDLPEAMRKQAQAKLEAVGTKTIHVCEDDGPGEGRRQAAVKVDARLIEHDGEKLSLTQWARRLGITRQAFAKRLKQQSPDRWFSKARALSAPEERLALHLRAEGIEFERQYRWCPGRRYKADFAHPMARLLVEVQGGTHIRGKRSHTGAIGYEYDRMRNNEAVILGWRMLEFTPKHIKSGRAIREIKRALEAFRT